MSYSEIKQLKVASINFQSILNKVSSFHEFIHNYDPDIILGSESWLTAEVFLMKYFHLIIILSEKTGSSSRVVVCLSVAKILFSVRKSILIMHVRL